MSDVKPPAKNPCGSCPYRQDVPSGVWAPEEYAKLPRYDNDTAEQPMGMFLCHQQDGRLCAGWVGCHDMDDNLGVKIAVATRGMDKDTYFAVLDYETEVPLWSSGAEAAAHGMAEMDEPSPEAKRKIDTLLRKGVARTE